MKNRTGFRIAQVVGVAFLCGAAAFQQAAAPNLVAYYPLDETAAGTVDDAVGSNDGMHADAPAPNTTDKAPLLFPNAASLAFTADGSGTTGDRITLPQGVVSGKTNLTVTWWIKTAKTGNQAIVSGNSAASNNEFLVFLLNNVTYRHHVKGLSVDVTIPSISNNAWHHFAVVQSAGGNQVTVYTDGVARGSGPLVISSLLVDPNGLIIGEEQDSVGGGYDAAQSLEGLLDDLRFYDRVLTAGEVGYLAAGNGPPPAPTGLAATIAFPTVDLTWNAVTTNPATPVTYTVLRGTTPGGPYPTVVATGVQGTTYNDATAAAGSTYYYVVTATNVGGQSANSNQATAVVVPPPPRFDDHEEGLFEDKCNCATTGIASAGSLAGALAGLLLVLALRRSRQA